MARPRRGTRGRGGARVGAGKKKKPVADIKRRAKEKRVEKVLSKITEVDEYEIVRKAFIRLTSVYVGEDAAMCVRKCTISEEDATQILSQINVIEAKAMELEIAAALLLHLELTKFQYSEMAVMVNKAAGVKLIPCYNRVRVYRTLCRPDFGITVDEACARVRLDALLSHTIERLVEAYGGSIDDSLGDARRGTQRITACNFVLAYGMDAATGQRQYQQRFKLPENATRSDSSLFAVVFNPLKLEKSDGSCLWMNETPQSPVQMRPYLIEFQKETQAYVLRIVEEIEQEHRDLDPIIVKLPSGRKLKVAVKLHLTMIDGKIFNFLSGTNAQQCPTCKAEPAQLNDAANISTEVFQPKGDGLKHGMQPLHAYMKFTRHVLNLSFRKPVQHAIEQARSRGKTITAAKKRELREKQKKKVQNYYLRKGMRVDFPNQYGSGNTLDGNLCKRLFNDPEELAKVLGIEVDLVRRYRIILICINNTRFKLKGPKFQAYCRETFDIFQRRYPWFKISPSIHKIYQHAHEIQEQIPFPPGATGEGGAETKHKKRKYRREHNTRKTDRKSQMTDMLMRELDASDPVVAKRILERTARFRKSDQEAFEELPEEARRLLDTGEMAPRVSSGTSAAPVLDATNETSGEVPGPSRATPIGTRRTTVAAAVPTPIQESAGEITDEDFDDVYNDVGENILAAQTETLHTVRNEYETDYELESENEMDLS